MSNEAVCVIATEANWSEFRRQAGSQSVSRMSHFARLADIPFGASYSAYVIDAEVPDLDLWPLPVLARQVVEDGPDDTGDVSAHLIRMQGETRVESISASKALNIRAFHGVNELVEVITEMSAPESARKLASARYVDAGGGVFLVQMRNGTSYLLKRSGLDESDASEVISCTLSEDGEYFEVAQASGNTFEVPWDGVLYHCEPAYEYYKGKQPEATEGSDRAVRIGRRIRDLRKRQGLSVSALALRAGMQRSNLSRVEAGKHVPSLDTLEKIADALEVPVASLVAK